MDSAPPSDSEALLAEANADPKNWRWDNTGWVMANQNWQDFIAEWFGQSKPMEKSLSESLGLFAAPPTKILVRNCYVDMFHRVWERGLGLGGRAGTIITGQSGIGASILTCSMFPI